MSLPIITDTTDCLIEPCHHVLEQARSSAPGSERHDALAERLPALHAIEKGKGRERQDSGLERLVIASWNAERCKFRAESAKLLGGLNADVILLTEMDQGMVRSGNRHTIRDLATDLGMNYVFAVEYIELGLGDNREKLWHAGQCNSLGLHGNGILSFSELRAPFVIRLDEQGRWFAGSQDTSERRIGWRMAIGGFLRFRETELCVVSVHLESSTDKWDRERQMARLFNQLVRQTDGCPVIIGGDLNTSSLPPANGPTDEWFECPEKYEPLFELAQSHGYEWHAFNDNLPTERTRPDGTPVPPFRKIDWFLTSGLRGSNPETVPALGFAGNAISDHDVILVTCAIERSGLNNGR